MKLRLSQDCPNRLLLLVFGASLVFWEKIEIAFPDQIFRVLDAETMRKRMIDVYQPALAVYEIDAVRHVGHKGIKDVFLANDLTGSFLHALFKFGIELLQRFLSSLAFLYFRLQIRNFSINGISHILKIAR